MKEAAWRSNFSQALVVLHIAAYRNEKKVEETQKAMLVAPQIQFERTSRNSATSSCSPT
jgi:hypothetical protein